MSGSTHGSGAPPSGGHEEEPGSAEFAQLGRIVAILRRRWIVLVVCLVLGGAGAVLAASVLPPRWTATATVVLHMSGPQVLDKVKGVTEEADGRATSYRDYYQTHRNILGSRTVAERALEKLGLAEDPTFLGLAGETDPAKLAEKKAAIDPVERLRDMVSIGEVRNSRILKVSATYPDPQIAADMANAVVDAYLEHVRSSRTRLGAEARTSLMSEREKALAALRAAEQALSDFKRDHEITSVSLADRQNVITQNILTLSTRVKQAEAERITLESTYTQAKRLHAAGNLAGATLLPAHERSLFQQLRQELLAAEREFEQVTVEFGPKAPAYQKAKARLDLIRKTLDREGSDLIASLEARLRAARDTERKLADSLAAEQKNALALSQLEREYRELERNSKTTAEAYGMVAKRETEVGMTNRIEAENVEILDRAHPPAEPQFPRLGQLVALGLLGGLGMGSLLAVALDLRDQRLRSLADLERALSGTGLPVLGVLPTLPPDDRIGVGNVRAQRRRRDLHAILFPQSLMAERCRGIRTSLAFSQAGMPVRTLMITSPSSAEGKSSTAMNLALSFCQANKRVVLIDADMRRPRIHQAFPPPVEQEGVGLAQVLSGQATLAEALAVPDEEAAPDNLRVLPCGTLPPNPAELLDTPAFRKLLADLREQADIIILDSPPVLPVTDPLIIARQVDGVCLVARCGNTTRGELQRALSLLRQGDTNLLGVILNEVSARQESYAYRYSYYVYGARDGEAERA